jgi:hypothetical protein
MGPSENQLTHRDDDYTAAMKDAQIRALKAMATFNGGMDSTRLTSAPPGSAAEVLSLRQEVRNLMTTNARLLQANQTLYDEQAKLRDGIAYAGAEANRKVANIMAATEDFKRAQASLIGYFTDVEAEALRLLNTVNNNKIDKASAALAGVGDLYDVIHQSRAKWSVGPTGSALKQRSV